MHKFALYFLSLVLCLGNVLTTVAGELEPQNRKVPKIPPKGQRIRVIIDTDAKNEIDDQWAIALAILSPERFEIEGFIGANFDNPRGGPEGIEKSVEKSK